MPDKKNFIVVEYARGDKSCFTGCKPRHSNYISTAISLGYWFRDTTVSDVLARLQWSIHVPKQSVKGRTVNHSDGVTKEVLLGGVNSRIDTTFSFNTVGEFEHDGEVWDIIFIMPSEHMFLEGTEEWKAMTTYGVEVWEQRNLGEVGNLLRDQCIKIVNADLIPV